MRTMLIGALLLSVVSMPAFAQEADPSACIAQLNANFTCYAPGKDPVIEGPFATSKPGLNGKSIPITLDDVRIAGAQGKSIPVTLAGNPINYGKYYNIGTITYTSAIDGATYTMTNVVGYVHDTGSAFREGSCSKYNTCADIYRKLDIAHGDYRTTYSRGGIFDVDHGPSCTKVNRTVCQTKGPLTTAPVVTSQGVRPGNDQRMSLANLGTGGWGTGNGTGVTTAPGVTATPSVGGSSVPQQTIPQPPQQSVPLSTTALQAVNTQTGTVGETITQLQSTVAPTGFLLVQPRVLNRGQNIVISWGALGAIGSCTVTMQTESGARQGLAQVRAGTRTISTTPTSIIGVRTFVLSCQTAGAPFEKTVPVTIR